MAFHTWSASPGCTVSAGILVMAWKAMAYDVILNKGVADKVMGHKGMAYKAIAHKAMVRTGHAKVEARSSSTRGGTCALRADTGAGCGSGSSCTRPLQSTFRGLADGVPHAAPIRGGTNIYIYIYTYIYIYIRYIIICIYIYIHVLYT